MERLNLRRRLRRWAARLVAGPQLNQLWQEVNQQREEMRTRLGLLEGPRRDELWTRLDSLQDQLDALRAGAIDEIVARDDAVHFAQERRLAAVANRVLALEESVRLAQLPEGRPPASSDDVMRSHQQPLLLDPAVHARFSSSERHREGWSGEAARWASCLRGHPPVLDLNCGEGELLETLRDQGIPATGFEANPVRAQSARERGLTVVTGDLFEYLWGRDRESVGSVALLQVVEYHPPAEVEWLLTGIRRVLRRDGLLVIDSLDPRSDRVLSEVFWSDPTRVRPYAPEALEVLLENAGFTVAEGVGEVVTAAEASVSARRAPGPPEPARPVLAQASRYRMLARPR